MASKKKAKAKKKGKAKKTVARKTAAKKKAPKFPRPMTVFMQAFKDTFIRDPVTKQLKWPPTPLPTDGVAFSNISDVLQLLGNARAGVPPASGGTQSFRDQVADFIIARQWPSAGPV